MDSRWYIKYSTTSSTHEDLILSETFSVHNIVTVLQSVRSSKRSSPVKSGNMNKNQKQIRPERLMGQRGILGRWSGYANFTKVIFRGYY